MPALFITIKETFDGRGMTYRAGGERDYVRTFWATSNIVTDPQAILLSNGIPRLGEIYVTAQGGVDTRATCRDVDAKQRPEHPCEWRVTANYSSARVSGSGGSGGSGAGSTSETGGAPSEAGQDNPLLRPCLPQFGTKKYQRPAEFDVLPSGGGPFGAGIGNPIVNAAGDKFDPPLMEDCVNLTITLSRNLVTFDPQAFRTLQNTINQFEYLGFPPKTLKVDSIESVFTFEAGVYYFATKVILEVAPEGETWVRKVLNVGYNEVVAGKKRPIVLPGGRTPSVPYPLASDGSMLPAGGTPNYLGFQTNRAVDFRLLSML